MPNEPQIGIPPRAKEAASLAPQKQGSDDSSFSIVVGQLYDGPLDLLLD
jgi:hypothetical protein